MTDEAVQYDRIVSIVKNLVGRIHPDGCHWEVRRDTDNVIRITLPAKYHPYWTRDMWTTTESIKLISDKGLVEIFEVFMDDGDKELGKKEKENKPTREMLDVMLKAVRAEMELRSELHRNEITELYYALEHARRRLWLWSTLAFTTGAVLGMLMVAILVINSGGAK